MAEDNFNPENDDNNDNNSEDSPSAMFLEMMRQAAMRDTESMPPVEPEPEIKFADMEFVLAPEENPDAVTEQTPDTLYIPESELFPDAESAPNDVRSEIHEYQEDIIEEEIPEPEIEPESLPPSIQQGRVPIYTAPQTSEIDEERASKLEAQRIRRLKRRQQRRQRRRVGILGGFFRTTFAVIVAAVLASTVFTWFTDPEFFNPGVVNELQVADATSVNAADPLTPTVNPVTPNWARRIGIVSGHRGPENDPGAVCEDGLTEQEINFAVAQLVVRNLRDRGYSVDLLDEFDPRLQSYQASALVSIHANDCRDYGEYVSGYLVARASARPGGGLDDILAECIARDYGEATQIERSFSLTVDMTNYHTFREIHSLTPATIIELGFMKDDRDLLTNQQDLLAEGITDGIICFLSGENPIATGTEFPTESFGITPLPLEQATAEGG